MPMTPSPARSATIAWTGERSSMMRAQVWRVMGSEGSLS
jgi:hypothetical protein